MPKVLPQVEGSPEVITGWVAQCPACGNSHRFDTKRWVFNGNVDSPTFTPSMLVRGGAPKEPLPDSIKVQTCHSFLTDGKWNYLPDCTHAMKGQTVDVPDWNISLPKDALPV